MQPTQATTWITEARFAPYLEEAGGEHEKALALYVWNARISAAAFEALHHVEVILRNAVDAQFAPLEGSASPRDTWLENPAVLNDASRQRVHETIGRISREGKTPTRGRVVAGLSFGFWRALFDKKYAALWVSHLHRAFPAGSGERAEVATLMSNLVLSGAPAPVRGDGHMGDFTAGAGTSIAPVSAAGSVSTLRRRSLPAGLQPNEITQPWSVARGVSSDGGVGAPA